MASDSSIIELNIAGMLDKILSDLEEHNRLTEKKIGKHHSDQLMENKENELYHDTYYFEQEYYSYVEKGDVEGLKEFIKKIPNMNVGRTATDSIRQAKNLFIASTTLITRRAIDGGLDIETAYQLSDSYILEAEKMTDVKAINFLNMTCIIDFAKRVSEAKVPMGMSKEIFSVIQYISNHVNTNITVEQIADELHMDRSTLSKKFKRELGFNISTYIMRRKLEEAKSLLHYTDKTISEISEYLCFSSQSYFQNVFKAKYGMTPKEYRNQTL
ncbi:AraC family transcriptional regulator [Pseudobutyrivibrio xylanivorans]|uniref:YSIRK-targeted surface antigen transcriptional regulator n=1 Tax=Pseudobutyrivibrio xylanivorans TaxID=185007 RepID=A0A1G5RZJ5_PSEXY|nr:AraC family transcriptional regulator [Pseudobutyrivibrio xylanivorans]SCZ79426.1 YSIRK-targeted surface antigen transcriptional regulator [Pseudobutyrivibrio xylanivorans]